MQTYAFKSLLGKVYQLGVGGEGGETLSKLFIGHCFLIAHEKFWNI